MLLKCKNQRPKQFVQWNNYYLLKEKIPKLKEHCTNVIDITDAFEDIDKPVFADRMHTGSYGNEIIADRIYEEMQ